VVQKSKPFLNYSVNRMQNLLMRPNFFVKVDCKRSMISVGINYSMYDLIFDVINYCASRFDMDIVNVYKRLKLKT